MPTRCCGICVNVFDGLKPDLQFAAPLVVIYDVQLLTKSLGYIYKPNVIGAIICFGKQ